MCSKELNLCSFSFSPPPPPFLLQGCGSLEPRWRLPKFTRMCCLGLLKLVLIDFNFLMVRYGGGWVGGLSLPGPTCSALTLCLQSEQRETFVHDQGHLWFHAFQDRTVLLARAGLWSRLVFGEAHPRGSRGLPSKLFSDLLFF